MQPFNWSLFAVCFVGATLGGLAVYHSVAGYYHRRYYLQRRHEPEKWKCQPKRFLTPEMHRRAILVGTGTLALSGTVTGILVFGMIEGYWETAIYLDIAEYGWAYTLAMTAVLFLMMDCIAYWVHRTLHLNFLYRHVHRAHHRFIATSPYVATAMHPVEMLILQAATFVPLFFIPFHAASVAVVLVYILAYNVVDHSGVRLVSVLPWQPLSQFHDDHHTHFHVNFGQHLTIWDRLHGTLRRENRRYGEEVFGGRGAREGAGGADDRGPYVRY